MNKKLKTIGQRLLPFSFRRWILRYTRWPPVGGVNFENLRRLSPISSCWGGDRGLPIDRYYIEHFLTLSAGDVRGHVLEIGDNKYTHEFGDEHVKRSEVLDVSEDNPHATILADLSSAPHIPSNTFDCIICTQTLQFIFDVESAIDTLHRILKPRGILLATAPGISQIGRYEMDRWRDYWRFTTASARQLFLRFFPTENIQVKSYGNVLAAIGFLHGLATEELSREELDHLDPDYEVLITIRAEKSQGKE